MIKVSEFKKRIILNYFISPSARQKQAQETKQGGDSPCFSTKKATNDHRNKQEGSFDYGMLDFEQI